MSLFSIIAENADYLDLVQSEKAKEWLKTIAGKYKVYRFELGNNQELWEVITFKIDAALEEWGVDLIQGYYYTRPLSRDDLLSFKVS